MTRSLHLPRSLDKADCSQFLNELVKRGSSGGDEAAKLLRRAVFEYLRYDEDFKHDYKIVIRVYANIRGLSKTYADKGILPSPVAFQEFVLGFNKAHPLCDFIDAGNHKEAADTKLKGIGVVPCSIQLPLTIEPETLSLYVYNVHCKQIVFGGSADNGFASFLSSSFIDTDVSSRLRLLKGPPFSFEFKNILPKFGWTEFPHVFNSDFISNQPALQPNTWRKSQDVEHLRTSGQASSITVDSPAMPWRPRNWGEMLTDKVPRNGNAAVGSRRPPAVSQPKGAEVDEDSDGEGVEISAKLQDILLSGSPQPSSSQIPTTRRTSSPNPDVVVATLISCTNERLEESPKALDFGVVKQRVEQRLGLPPGFWGRDESNQWYSRSKNVIKMAVEDWVERTNNFPPLNATWMLHHFTSTDQAPSAILRDPASAIWRTICDNDSARPSVRLKQTSVREVPNRIYRNKDGQRIDIPVDLSTRSRIANELRDREPRLCNTYHLVRQCFRPNCPYDHDSVLSDSEHEALMYLSRCQPCPNGSGCTMIDCTRGHMCPNGSHCSRGSSCRFAKLHSIDTSIVQLIPRGGPDWV